ncbi:unnamed protein product [Nippostrongylus brasiliensis]|uniref:SANT domain-containing protein n=1 Tax=Nippostrongylus brasiliensis TaxID=27835 RepID=A0A0N4YN01_NIPBR|nr:unnamed protein product [Nippostrongylus brasiliensis]
MRTSNPLRDEVWEAVHRQVQLASEGIKEIIEQGAGIEQQPNEFSEVCEILGIAGLNETSRLEKFLDESVENERCAREICGVLQCEKSELVTRVAELKKAVDTKSEVIAQMQSILDDKQLQMRELARQVQLMENRMANETGSQQPPGESGPQQERWLRFRNIGLRTDPKEGGFQGTSTHDFLNPSIHRYSSRWHKSEFEKRKEETSMWATGTMLQHERYDANDGVPGSSYAPSHLVEYMKLSALPEISPFYGREKESFKRFVGAFSVKYPPTMWDDKSRIHLFEFFKKGCPYNI